MEARKPPYFAVIFTSTLKPGQAGYQAMAKKMESMVSLQKGFLDFDSARGEDGPGITVSYWESREAIRSWREVAEHRRAQEQGRSTWYSLYNIKIAEVLEDRGLGSDS